MIGWSRGGGNAGTVLVPVCQLTVYNDLAMCQDRNASLLVLALGSWHMAKSLCRID